MAPQLARVRSDRFERDRATLDSDNLYGHELFAELMKATPEAQANLAATLSLDRIEMWKYVGNIPQLLGFVGLQVVGVRKLGKVLCKPPIITKAPPKLLDYLPVGADAPRGT